MRGFQHKLNFKRTAAEKPEDYQECLIHNPCEGFMIATWKNLGGDQGFYLFGTYEPLPHDLTPIWAALPTSEQIAHLR
ncbi:hypothetical protein SAMN03159444_01390 [Pseudomonas sp. NFACC02]|uniref:hypothetical protein n=1 Tax=Pseudomonas sp. NFACC02 TaxID=1566250 RepID=UPI0008D8303F|nr:hypothetical protein [Pseudomonas sp. NFACC02]SEQ27442.1 hypothetical protein SAMN03159444_01390 [Pseudomonas sp. NFACC02]